MNSTLTPQALPQAGQRPQARRRRPKPPWLKVDLPSGPVYTSLRNRLRKAGLPTVCQSARCPNVGECWAQGTATLMLLGEVCTRGCRFCAVTSGRPAPPDPREPARVVQTVRAMGLDYVVLTMVDRDDLDDGGAAQVAATVKQLRANQPDLVVELLTGDFQGHRPALATVAGSGARVLAHNLETVERLTPRVRDARCSYRRSLRVLAAYKELAPERLTKSSLMLGLGETQAEVGQALRDLREAGVDSLTLGQYLQPTARHLPIDQYIKPEQFAALGEEALELGFEHVAAGPLVRSSFRAAEVAVNQLIIG